MNETLVGTDLPSWQRALQQGVADLDELVAILSLAPEWLAGHNAMASFPLRVPRGFVAKMQPGDPYDPLLLQVLPRQLEEQQLPGYVMDPLAEAQANPLPGLVHKYQGRVLLTLTGHCAINCRYCFRRHFPYENNRLGSSQRQQVIDYIAANETIVEVILSGGDPLVLPDRSLSRFVQQLEAIPHVQRLRIHTRLPVVLPERIDGHLLEWIQATRLQTVMVWHVNHPRELDQQHEVAVSSLRRVGVTLLNQSVLLRHINDNVEVLVALSERLFAVGILPYYLHLLDPTHGVAHFDVPEQDALSLFRGIQQRLPGYLVPRLVRELPHRGSKTLVI